MPKNLNIFAPFAKVNTTEDGGREVWGFATLERVDKSNEIADFEGTFKAFETWSSEIEKNTQGKSKGNIRVMHQPETGGTVIDWQAGVTKIEEDGEEKEVKGIWVGSYVPPHKADVIADIDAGILSAYSIGGSYAKKWLDTATGAKRYIPVMSELSLVDNPAVPGAEFQLVKFETGPWEDKTKNKEVERLTAEQMAKAAQAAGISLDKLTVLFAELAKAKPAEDVPEEKDLEEHTSRSEDDKKEQEDEKKEETKEGDKAAPTDVTKDDDADAAAGNDGVEKLVKSVTGSYEHVQSLLRAAVNRGWSYRSLEATFPDHVIVRDYDKDTWFNVPYTVESGSVTLGDAVEVEQDFKPIQKSVFNELMDIEELELIKSGAAISEKNREKLHKAASHIHDTCACDKCMKAAGIYADPDGGNTGEEPEKPPVKKDVMADMQKAVGFSFAEELQKAGLVKQDELAKAVSAFTSTLETVNKSVEAVGKQVETFEKSTNDRLKAIEEAPVSGGPLLFGATGESGSVPAIQKSATESEFEILSKAQEATNDPVLRDVIGRKLATMTYKNQR